MFHDFIAKSKDYIFTDAADVIMTRLSKAAEAIGAALDDALKELAKKVSERRSGFGRMRADGAAGRS